MPAPTFGEEPRARLVAAKLEQAGAHTARDAAGNVVARFGPPDGAAAVIAAHLDTVFPAGTPLPPARDGDRLRGPGIGDDSLALAGLVHLAGRGCVRRKTSSSRGVHRRPLRGPSSSVVLISREG
jgi:acetylornithine deacetylase/succinyl-diaminopimelate desuccinylase-like protein